MCDTGFKDCVKILFFKNTPAYFLSAIVISWLADGDIKATKLKSEKLNFSLKREKMNESGLDKSDNAHSDKKSEGQWIKSQ